MLAHPSQAEYILMDLDGTLIDSSPGIVRALRYALARMGIAESNEARLVSFIGPPLYESFGEAYGFSREKSAEATLHFQSYYEDQGWTENALYPGIREWLSLLHGTGHKLIMATSKPECFAMRIAERFSISSLFTLITGGDEEERLAEKGDIIETARQRLHLERFGSAVMVGDRKYDVLGAARHHIPSVGVLYGYGSRQELLAAGARWFAKDTQELMDLWL